MGDFRIGEAEMAESLFRETGELSIEVPACRRPTIPELRWLWPDVLAIEYDESPELPVTLVVGTFLRVEERAVNGNEYGCRRQAVLSSLLGPQHALLLQEKVNSGRLPELFDFLGKFCLDFFGMVVRGRRSSGFARLSLYDDGRVHLVLHPIGDVLYQRDRVAFVGK